MADYFTHRKQRVKMGVTRSEWSQVIKETPQGPDQYVFNILQNVPIKNLCDIYNHTDDNTVGCMPTSFQQLKINLQMSVRILLHWYESNCMRANPDKFQYIVFRKEHESNEPIAITDVTTLSHWTHVNY